MLGETCEKKDKWFKFGCNTRCTFHRRILINQQKGAVAKRLQTKNPVPGISPHVGRNRCATRQRPLKQRPPSQARSQ